MGHLVLGECARVQLGLELVLFMPAGDPWQKASRNVSPSSERLAMTDLAIAENPNFHLDRREVDRTGPTYTVDTLRELHAQGMDDLVLIVGSDALTDMPTWRQPEVITSLARLAVAPKDTTERGAPKMGLASAPLIVEMPLLSLSSTLVRERVRKGKPIRYLVPETVEAYIHDHALYR
tara:strand:- start:12022 stop:12555 length:534 start_codon:yes stop_codon:yes gene_type:complete